MRQLDSLYYYGIPGSISESYYDATKQDVQLVKIVTVDFIHLSGISHNISV